MIKPGTVIADPFGSPDVYPTLAGLAGVKPPRDSTASITRPLLAAKPRNRHATMSISKCRTPMCPGPAGGRFARDNTYGAPQTNLGCSSMSSRTPGN